MLRRKMIHFGVDCPGPLCTRSLVENPRPYRVSLSDVRVIMVFICILRVELLCQAVMRQIPALKCLLLGPRGSQWLRLVLTGSKWSRHPRTLAHGLFAQYRRPPGMAFRGQARGEPGHKDELDRVDRW
jgi:hypothetical protein